MSETTKKPAPRRSRAKPKTAPKARSDAGTPLCAVFTAGPDHHPHRPRTRL